MGKPRSEVRRTIRLSLAVLVGLWAGLGSSAADPAAAPERPLKKIRVAYSSLSGSQAPLWVAQERGLFRKHGLDLEIVFLESGRRAVAALASGEVALAQAAGTAVLQSRLRGGDAVLIGGFLNTLDYQLIVHPEITQPQHLKGKRLAVSRFGSSSDFATRYALKSYGLDPAKDVTLVEIGSQPARFAALEAGKIQGAMIAVPLTAKAKKMDFRVLADLAALGLEYQHTGMAAKRAFIRSDRDTVLRAMKAMVEAIHYLKTHRHESIDVLQRYLGGDREALVETYETVALALMPEKPYPTLRGIQIVLTELAAEEPKARSARPEDFVDLSLVRDLDRSGFIDRLYGAPPAVAQAPAPAESPIEPRPAVSRPGDRRREHTTRPGETLAAIALRYYGDGDLWTRLYHANRDAIRDPDLIYVGQKILVPDEGSLREVASR